MPPWALCKQQLHHRKLGPPTKSPPIYSHPSSIGTIPTAPLANSVPKLCNPQSKAAATPNRSMSYLQIPLQPPTPFANGYLQATSQRRQPLCGNSEGWGPISRDRYDFTPCFLDVWIATVATAGILGGAGAAWYLLRKCTSQPVKKNWHFYAKLVRISE